MTTQSVSSIVRQFLAILAVIFGVLTSSVSSLHLPTSVSTALTVIGGILLAVEHYVSDPSTGTSSPAPVTTPSPAAVQKVA